MLVHTNASKKDRKHMIDVSEEHLNYIRKRFKNMVRKFKILDAGFILPGLKLHYKIFPDGKTRVSFEEKNNGVALEQDWYEYDDLIDLPM